MESLGKCVKCNVREATIWWVGEGDLMLSFVHGQGEPYCERCCIESKLDFARKISETIPELEKRLAELP